MHTNQGFLEKLPEYYFTCLVVKNTKLKQVQEQIILNSEIDVIGVTCKLAQWQPIKLTSK